MIFGAWFVDVVVVGGCRLLCMFMLVGVIVDCCLSVGVVVAYWLVGWLVVVRWPWLRSVRVCCYCGCVVLVVWCRWCVIVVVVG